MKIHSCLPIYHNSCDEHARLLVQRPEPWWQDCCCWAVEIFAVLVVCLFLLLCYSLLLAVAIMFVPQSRQWACAAPGSSVAGLLLLLLAKMAALPLLPCAQLTFFYIFPKFCRLTRLRVVDIDTVKGLGWWTSNMPDIFLVFMLSLSFLALGIYFHWFLINIGMN